MDDNYEALLWAHAMEMNPDRNQFLAKALAHFLFREIMEPAHVKYHIRQEDMKMMNKQAANRALFFIQEILPDKECLLAFGIESIQTAGWDDAEITEEEKESLELYNTIVDEIGKMNMSLG